LELGNGKHETGTNPIAFLLVEAGMMQAFLFRVAAMVYFLQLF
jgi:hypothetical protein